MRGAKHWRRTPVSNLNRLISILHSEFPGADYQFSKRPAFTLDGQMTDEWIHKAEVTFEGGGFSQEEALAEVLAELGVGPNWKEAAREMNERISESTSLMMDSIRKREQEMWADWTKERFEQKAKEAISEYRSLQYKGVRVEIRQVLGKGLLDQRHGGVIPVWLNDKESEDFRIIEKRSIVFILEARNGEEIEVDTMTDDPALAIDWLSFVVNEVAAMNRIFGLDECWEQADFDAAADAIKSLLDQRP